MLRFLALLGCLALLTTAQAHARTEGGDPLWQDEFGVIEMTADGSHVAAIGTVTNPAGTRRSIVRVYDADKGRRLWQAAVAAVSVVLDGNRVVVAGGGRIRAYDTKKGSLAWQDTPPFRVTQLYRDESTTLAVSAQGTAIRVRVYDTKRGTVLVSDRTVGDDTLPFPRPAAFSGGKMFIATSAAVDDPTDDTGRVIFPCQVRAYSLATGQQLWATTQPFLFPNTWDCFPIAVTADRKRVILTGIGGFGDEFMAQGYDSRTGTFLWQHLSLIGTAMIDAAVSVDFEGRLAFVAGWTANPFVATSVDQDFVIHALDAETGALRWEARTPGADCRPPQHCQVHAKLVVADSGTVYGAGFKGESGHSIPGTGFLRAYEARSGRLRWEQDLDVEAIAATRGGVFVLTPGSREDDAILRAFDGK